jgi:hypothetical protein
MVGCQRANVGESSLPGTFVPALGCPAIAKKRAAMDNEPKRQEPEIMPPAPIEEPQRGLPEIPSDKDAPEKKGPIRGGVDVSASFDGV